MTASLGQRIARQATLLGSAYLLARILDIPFRLFATNRLGEVEYGEFGFALTVAAFASFAADLGLDQYTTRQIPRMKGGLVSSLPGILWLRLRTTVLMVLILLLVVAGLITFSSTYRPGLLFLAVGYSLVLTALSFCRSVSRGTERMKYEAAAVSLEKIALVVAGLVLILLSPTANALFIGFFISGIVSLVYLFRRLTGEFGTRPFIPARRREHVWREAWAFGAGGLILMALYREDVVLLRLMRGAADTGIYTTTFLVLEALLLPAQMISFAVLPVLSDGWNQRKPIGPTVARLLGLFGALMLPITLGGMLVSRDLMLLLFPRFINSLDAMSQTFTVLIATLPFICGNYIVGTLLLAVDRQRYNLLCSVWAFVLNLLLNLLLIPRFGPVGAATATLITQAAFLACLTYGGRDCIQWSFPKREWAGLVVGLGAMAGVVIALGNHHVLWRVLAGAAIYTIIGKITGIIRIGDFRKYMGSHPNQTSS